MQRLLGRGVDRQRGELGASNAAGALREKSGSYGLLGGPVEVTRPASRHSRCIHSALLSEIVRYKRCHLLCVVVRLRRETCKGNLRELSVRGCSFLRVCVYDGRQAWLLMS